jgi:predicted membrane GTPase involved in stress response
VNCNCFEQRVDYGVVVGGTVEVLVDVVLVDVVVVVVDASTTCMPYVRNAFTVKVARVL